LELALTDLHPKVELLEAVEVLPQQITVLVAVTPVIVA